MTRPRVAHLNFIDEPGVTRKLREQAASARGLGLPIDFYAISDGFQDSDDQPLKLRRRRALRVSGQMRFLLRLFLEEDLIADYLDPEAYDFFIIRFGKVFLEQGVTYRRHGAKILTEHHTDEIAELLVKPTLGRRLLAAVSRRRSSAALRRVAGIVAVTDEILQVELRKSGPKPSLVLPNGISVPADRAPPRTYARGQLLEIVFVAADFQPWQGLDRIVDALRRYEGQTPIRLHLVGRLDSQQARVVASFGNGGRKCISAHGLLPVNDVRGLYAACHVAIGSLAVTRKAMHEGCSLKNREYAAWGLPFAIAFVDPDFPPAVPFCLRLPEEPAPLDLVAIVRFAEDIYADGDPGESIHSYAVGHLDWNAKLTKLYEFICTL